MSDEFEKTVIGKCLYDEKYARAVLPHLEKHYFENAACQNVFKHLIQYMVKYNRRPTKDSLGLDVKDVETKTLLKHIDKYAKKEVDSEWLLNQTEDWCSTRAIEHAIIKSIAIIDGTDTKHTKGVIPDMLKNALSISFNPAIGHDWTKDAEKRYDDYNKHVNKLPFDLNILNDVTNGGVEPGTLNVLMSGTHGGKTLLMCHCAAHHLALGKNVLYITMEMAEEKIAERIDANLLDIDIDELQSTNKDFFLNRVSGISTKTAGRLMIKQYPTTQANVNHFRALINDYKTKLDFIPDVVYIDYLNICGCARLKGGTYKSYDFVKAIAEEVRGLAIEKNVPIITATQTNRAGYSDSDVEITSTSDSFGVPQTADLFWAIIKNESLDAENKIMIKQLKNRYKDLAYKRRFMLGVEIKKMRFYDLDDPTQGVTQTDSRNDDDDSPSQFSLNRGNKRRSVNLE